METSEIITRLITKNLQQEDKILELKKKVDFYTELWLKAEKKLEDESTYNDPQ